jgi:cytochrome c
MNLLHLKIVQALARLQMFQPASLRWSQRLYRQNKNWYVVFTGLLLLAALSSAACAGQVNGAPSERSVPQGNARQGKDWIVQYGCGSCHTIGGIPGADAKVGPPLTDFYERDYVAGRLPNTWDNLVKWIQNPQSIEPGTAMPDLGVSETEARDIAAYLYKRPDMLDFLNR